MAETAEQRKRRLQEQKLLGGGPGDPKKGSPLHPTHKKPYVPGSLPPAQTDPNLTSQIAKNEAKARQAVLTKQLELASRRPKPMTFTQRMRGEGWRDKVVLERTAEARERINVDLKKSFRREGLYFGDINGRWDPLVGKAFKVKYATTPLAANAATAEYVATMMTQNAKKASNKAREAIGAQKQLSKDLPSLLKNKSLPEETKGLLKKLDALVRNPKGADGNAEAILAGYAAVKQLQKELERNKPKGWKKVLNSVVNAPGLKQALWAANLLSEEVAQQPLYALQRAGREGQSKFGQAVTFASAVPGLGFIAGGKSKRIRTSVDSYEERQKLREEGKLYSVGEWVQTWGGRYRSVGPGANVGSGAVDLLFQTFTDPLNYTPAALGRVARVNEALSNSAARTVARESGEGLLRTSLSDFTKISKRMAEKAALGLEGEAAQKAAQATRENLQNAALRARITFLENTKRGRNLQKAVEDILTSSKGFDADSLRKAIPGIDEQVAINMAKAKSTAEAMGEFKSAFARMHYSPTVSLRRQLFGSITPAGFKAPGGVGLGSSRTIRASEGLFDFAGRSRRALRGTEVRSTGRAAKAAAAQFQVIQAGLARAQVRFDDAYAAIADSVVGLPVEDRLEHIWETVKSDSGLADIFERSLSKAEKETLSRLGITNPTPKDLEKVGTHVTFEAFLKNMEIMAALASGEFGGDAAKQVRAEAKFGLGRKAVKDTKLIDKALGNTTLAAKDKTKLTRAEHEQWLSSRINTIENADARALLQKELDRVSELKGRKGLGLLDRKVETVLRDNVSEELGRLARSQRELVGAIEDPIAIQRRLSNPVYRVTNSLTEAVAPAKVAFLGYENTPHAIKQRTEAIDRWMASLDFDDFTRSQFRRQAEAVLAEDDLFRLVDVTLSLKSAQHGLPEDYLANVFKERRDEIKNNVRINMEVMLADGTIEADDAVYTLAQRGEVVFLPDPDDIKRTIREWRTQHGDVGRWDKARAGLSKAADAKVFGVHGVVSGKQLSIREAALSVHRKWKMLTVVPGTELALLGAGLGFANTDGDLGDKLTGAAQGSAVGLLTPFRYIMRVAGIEEGLRKFLIGGFNPEIWKPHLARYSTQTGLDLPFRPMNAVRAGDPIGIRAQRLLEVAAHEWELISPASNPIAKLARKDARYLDGYSRIINYQAHPESDAVAEMFLRRRAGEVDDAVLRQLFDDYVGTDSGKLWMRRMKGAAKGPKNAAEAFERYNDFFGRYFADPEIARQRLDAARQYAVDGVHRGVDPRFIKEAQRAGTLPEFIHAERTFTIPKSAKDAALLRDRLMSKFAFEGPTTTLNRAPMAKAIYEDEYLRMVEQGVDRKRAQEIAEQTAAERTNKVMFRIDDESRFAAKVDPLFPFQQPREEFLRVWVPLIAQNKARALQATRLGAVMFNNGKENGMFSQNRYGEWRMTVPGSAYLGKLLFGSTSAFDFQLSDLMFFGQGAYNINIIPSPGGPYWSVLSRLAINRWPGGFEHLNPTLKEWLFPYGARGNLFRPEVSRLWQAWTGEAAPFEFASRHEQEEALEGHRHDIFLQLIWQHGQKTGDWSYRPSDEEVDEATSASLKAWAFIGAWFPASTRHLRPDQKFIDTLKDGYKDPNTGKFDFIAFSNDYPQYEPWMVGNTSTVDTSFDAWARTQDERSTDRTTHRRTTKKFSEWREELRQREAESKAYREKRDIGISGLDARKKQEMYRAWEKKYPELVAKTHENYERDIELMEIEGTLIGKPKEEALNLWRQRYGVTYPNYQRLVGQLRQGKLRSEFDPWESTRPAEQVFKDVQKQLRAIHYKAGDFETEFRNERDFVSNLSVPEQIRYWQWRLNHMDYDATDDPDKVMDRYWAVKNQVSSLYNSAPMKLDRAVSPRKEPTAWARKAAKLSEGYREQISDISTQIIRLNDEMEAAYGKNWDAWWAMRNKRSSLYDMKKALQNEWYQSIPDVGRLADEVKAVSVMVIGGRTDLIRQMRRNPLNEPYFLPTDQQAAYLSMNAQVRQAYVDDLVNALSGKKFNKYDKPTTLKWEYLTDFQQDLLERNLPTAQFEALRAGAYTRGGGGGGRGGKGWRGYGGPRSIGEAELSYAFAMFKQYNRRNGMSAPPAFKQYLELPADAVLRSAFLKQHPEVAEYIKLGPLANMPPALAMIVTDIMIRNGKWEGDPRSMTEISEIAFAREQLARWNRRGERKAPEAFELWRNMPTGPEKAAYLRAHPEIGEWLQLGPMANMPEHYREVVRDIMMRYGEWTDNQDPLGKVIQGYYATPSYGREKYLQEHPELVEYWKAIRTPEEQARFDMADHYFSIQDPMHRRAFLQVHPELSQWFLDQRQRRYENFLNQVAVYMGSSPELFEKYLNRQGDLLAELLNRFSQAPLMRERVALRQPPKSGKSRRTTS